MQPDPYTHIRLFEEELGRSISQRQLEHEARSREPARNAAGLLRLLSTLRGARRTVRSAPPRVVESS